MRNKTNYETQNELRKTKQTTRNKTNYKRKNKVNIVCVYISALHKDHGLAWTEGRSIFLSNLSLYQGQIENQEPSKLGEFE